jgi:NADPH:quinone reductase-like Zn-dependent oxidoreductase
VALRREVWPLLESRAVKVVVHATFPLRQVGEAHRLMEAGLHTGKLILTVAEEATP